MPNPQPFVPDIVLGVDNNRPLKLSVELDPNRDQNSEDTANFHNPIPILHLEIAYNEFTHTWSITRIGDDVQSLSYCEFYTRILTNTSN